IEITGDDPPQIARDSDGIALGGLRTPPVDVPVDVLSGVPGPNPSRLCQLFGSTAPLPDERISVLYPSPDDYLNQFTDAVNAVIAAGFALEADRDALIGYAQPNRV
nr:alpha/beta hydrolase domain-containing protein [Micromonospora sp. DSM 115978]